MTRYEGDEGRARADKYETLSAEELLKPLVKLLPSGRIAILDIGAGSGRDAAWLAGKQRTIVAVEPSPTMLAQAQRRHAGVKIDWLSDSLPSLEKVYQTDKKFDAILASAVWMHIPPKHRSKAFRRMISLLKPKGLLYMTLRIGPIDTSSDMFPTPPEEIETLARKYALSIVHREQNADKLGREDISWVSLIVQLPDNSTESLPLLRHIVLDDAKSSTYKLALLRSAMRVAVSAQGTARRTSGNKIAIPLGLVALYWLRLYHPLLLADQQRGFPQSPANNGIRGLRFIHKESWPVIAKLSADDLRAGARFTNEEASALHKTIRDTVDTIANMPARRIIHPHSRDPIFSVRKRIAGRAPRNVLLVLNDHYLRGFGEIVLETGIWREFARSHIWVEPALMMEWIRLMEKYAKPKGRILDTAEMFQALRWRDTERDVALANKRISELMQTRPVYCVWSGKKLNPRSYVYRPQIDHCLPRAVWPCEDLWNLLPTSAVINRDKGKRMPTADTMERSSDRIMDWWKMAWMDNPVIANRFFTEAKSSLPICTPPASTNLDEVFDGLQRHRSSLRSDHLAAEWHCK